MKLPRFTLTGSSIINVLGIIVIVYLIIVLAETIKRNYDLNHQITTLRTQITLLQDQKDQLSYNIQYYKTDAFREREAREKLGLQLPGENVIIVPQTTPNPTPASAAGAQNPGTHSNFHQWLDFFAGRSI